jgi:hypothetical protein
LLLSSFSFSLESVTASFSEWVDAMHTGQRAYDHICCKKLIGTESMCERGGSTL